jgi:3-isopropylmalate dehydrogenase
MIKQNRFNIAVLSGDGIGPEVMSQALRVLQSVAKRFDLTCTTKEGLIGGAAYARYQTHFPAETHALCSKADAILFGSVGGPVHEQHLPQWRGCEANSLLAMRKAFSFHANFRPVKIYDALRALSPLKQEILAEGVDMVIVRELLGDLYFGEHKREGAPGAQRAWDVATYTEEQIRLVAHRAFAAAKLRRNKVTSIDKANVLETGKLWREVVSLVHREYPEVTLEHMLVDNAAMQLMRRPAHFDVVLCPNMFGDILSDEAAVIPGSLGLMPSASFNSQGFAYYEPSGGSAPDIAGQGIANPIAQILSVALMLRYSLHHEEGARTIENAVENAIARGARTRDLALTSETKILTTVEITDVIIAEIEGARV